MSIPTGSPTAPARPAVRLQEPYGERPTRHVRTENLGGWRIKVYGIAYRGDDASPALVAAATRLAAQSLPQPAVTDSRYGVGFLTVHDGRGAGYVLLDWWESENELHHRLWAGPDADALAPIDGTEMACVHEMLVMEHERRAWTAHVLANPAGPDLDAYLADTRV